MNIIITGTSRGIGRALAEYFLANNHNVAGCSRGACDLLHDCYVHYELDINDEKKVTWMVRDANRKFGSIHVLINNAGIASMNHVLLTPFSTLKNIFETNVFGSFLFLREAAKLMQAHRYGRIINLTTVATPLNLEGELAYASSKAAVESLTRVASRELAEFNITVNAVGPTPVPTDLIKSVSETKMNELLNRQAIKRFGKIDDVINVIEFFMSHSSDFITGQTIYLGGVT
jgi:3-oxoacyl-[acyl-carrier protein] reductase